MSDMTATENRRTIAIPGGHNLRDLGGYETTDGRRVKWRTLYRSGAIYRLGEAERDMMRALGIVAICDLRTPDERALRPMDWHDEQSVHYFGGVKLTSNASLSSLAAAGEAVQQNMLAAMHHVYRRLPFEQAPSYRHLFGLLTAGRLPLLFNCSAGKDRTGVAAALLLAALGVPRETILEDYLLSNEAAAALLVMMTERDDRYAPLLARDPDALRPMLHAEADYLEMAFDEIEQSCGGLERYLEAHLGVDAAGLAALREHLLD